VVTGRISFVVVAFANRPGLHGALRNALTDLRLTGRSFRPAATSSLSRFDAPLWCPFGVKRRNTREEQMFSALAPKADSGRRSRHVREVPHSGRSKHRLRPVGDVLRD